MEVINELFESDLKECCYENGLYSFYDGGVEVLSRFDLGQGEGIYEDRYVD